MKNFMNCIDFPAINEAYIETKKKYRKKNLKNSSCFLKF